LVVVIDEQDTIHFRELSNFKQAKLSLVTFQNQYLFLHAYKIFRNLSLEKLTINLHKYYKKHYSLKNADKIKHPF
jgi:hypothetical protein